jgi:rare lipoprotein A
MTLLFVIALFPACAEKEFQTASLSSSTPAAAAVPAAEAYLYRETGIASWYGKELHGRKTASGELFDMNGLSASHRTLSLGTIVRVTNLGNFKSIKVKVNDRGPFAGNRVLELSYAAARKLAFVSQGTARVRIEALERQDENALYTVQAAVFTEEESAKLLKYRLSGRYGMITIVPFETNRGKFYHVHVGSYGTEEKAEQVAGKLKLEGLEPYILRKD